MQKRLILNCTIVVAIVVVIIAGFMVFRSFGTAGADQANAQAATVAVGSENNNASKSAESAPSAQQSQQMVSAQGGTSESSQATAGGSAPASADFKEAPTAQQNICTIAIQCGTILNNMGDLAEGKSPFVPANGVILATSSVEFAEGETVFDVLKAACSAAGIQLEYSYTPAYGAYYIEGINNLYEFDCGSESGWMYQVNGVFPNYGCSNYTVKPGDSIIWCYTCNGLGADVGGSV